MKKIPKLRFKEFSDEWEEKKLGEISEVKDGTHDSPKYIVDGFPLVTSKNVKNGKIDLNEVNYISKEDYDSINKRSKVSKGDILMGMIGTIGNLAIVDKENFAIKNVALIKEKEKLKNIFLFQLLQSNIFIKKINLLNEGGTQKFISLGNIRGLNFFLPTLQEQEKIGKFLSSVDKKISLTAEKLELFRQYKKGVMQKIFSQEMRFKDNNGNDYPAWEEKMLGDISDICTGKKDVEDKKENGVYPFFVRSQNVEKIDTYSYDGEAILIPGDGKIGEIFHYINGKFDYHQRVYKISDFNNIVGKYVYYYLENNFKRHALTYTAKATVDSLRLPVIKEFMLKLPCIEEQKKIAGFLSSIDNKIENIEKEVEGLKEFKKGLLQKMFV